ncbi:MAG: hypothetical protein F8N39_11715 [Clostridiaceae bacterium]|nr:hypothetical protein [Clostridiaceae bacterium]
MKTAFVVDGKIVGMATLADGMPAVVSGPVGSTALALADGAVCEVGWTCTVKDGAASFAPPVAPAKADDPAASTVNTKTTDPAAE